MKKSDPYIKISSIREKVISHDNKALKKALSKLERADICEVLDNLTREESLYLYKLIDQKIKPEVFGDISYTNQDYILRSITADEAMLLLESMPKDERNLFLSKIPRTRRVQIIQNMSEEDYIQWSKYSEDEIGHWLSDDYFFAYPHWSVKETIEALKGYEVTHNPVYSVYIVNQEYQLIDKLSLNKIVINEQSTILSELMDFQTASLNDTDSLDVVFERFQTRDAISMPIVNSKNVLVGVIFADDIMHLKQDRVTDEMHKMGGMETIDLPYMQSSILDQLKKRSLWLAVLFIGEMLTATALGYFENTLDQAVVLALFLPLILSSGGNSGSQSSTLIIRALALKEFELRDWPVIFRREIVTGILLGLFLGAIGLLRIYFWESMGWSDYTEHGKFAAVDVGLAVTVGIIGIVSWGNLVGALLPIAIRSLKLDPAVISAPFLATFVDVTGLIIYFSVARVLLGI